MQCLAVPKLPDGPEWQLELKLDGYRGIGIKNNGRAHLASRNGKNFTERSRRSHEHGTGFPTKPSSMAKS
jgi:ATP-dependent DNA ligase